MGRRGRTTCWKKAFSQPCSRPRHTARSAAARRFCSLLHLAPQSPAGSWGLEGQCPAPTSPLGTQTHKTWSAYRSMELLQTVTFPLHIIHTSHIAYTTSQVYTGHKLHTIYRNVLTLAYTYADKTTQKRAYETFTFTQDLTHLIHTYTDRHTALHTQAHATRACTLSALAVHMHWLLPE